MSEGCLIAAHVLATYPIRGSMRADGSQTKDHSPTLSARVAQKNPAME
jgi:hypothetical protein